MDDDLIDSHKAFPPESYDVVRIFQGLPGSVLKAREIRETVEIVWVRETSAQARLLLNGHEVADFNEFSDYYAFATASKNAVEDAKEMAEKFAVAPASDAVVEVHSWIVDVPTLGFAEDAYIGKAKRYWPARSKTGGALWINVPESGFESLSFEDRIWLDKVEHTKTLTWSSRWSAEENEAAAAAFEALARAEIRTVGATD